MRSRIPFHVVNGWDGQSSTKRPSASSQKSPTPILVVVEDVYSLGYEMGSGTDEMKWMASFNESNVMRMRRALGEVRRTRRGRDETGR